jgi:hypothetical protein
MAHLRELALQLGHERAGCASSSRWRRRPRAPRCRALEPLDDGELALLQRDDLLGVAICSRSDASRIAAVTTLPASIRRAASSS